MTSHNHTKFQLLLIGLQLTSLHCEVKNHCDKFDIGPNQGRYKNGCGRYHVSDIDREISLVAFQTARECPVVEVNQVLENSGNEERKFVVKKQISTAKGVRLIIAEYANTRLLIFCITSEAGATEATFSSKVDDFVDCRFGTASTRVVKYLRDALYGPIKTDIDAWMTYDDKTYVMAGAGMGGGLAVMARLLWSENMNWNPRSRLMTFSTPIIGNQAFYTLFRAKVPFAKYLRFDYCGSTSIKAIKMNVGTAVILGRKKTYFAKNRAPYHDITQLCNAERKTPFNRSGWTFDNYKTALETFVES